jgi:Transposase domain (DUF772)
MRLTRSLPGSLAAGRQPPTRLGFGQRDWRPGLRSSNSAEIILYAYSRGIVSSREIARLCHDNILFIALSADSQPHFTTIADLSPRSARRSPVSFAMCC